MSADEKEALDAWYIAHASLALDLRILAMTLRTLLVGDRRSERALAEARAERAGPLARNDLAAAPMRVAGAAPLQAADYLADG